ncbi:MAG: hypothetical protein ACOYO7_04725 [Phycisphaerales bacterium]
MAGVVSLGGGVVAFSGCDSVPVALGGGKVGVLHETAGYERIVFRVVEVPTPPVPMTAPRPQASP